MKIFLILFFLFSGIILYGFQLPMWKLYEITLQPFGNSASNFF